MSPEFPTGIVRKPPPLQSILRLQRTAGNHAAQRLLGIGDGKPVEKPPEVVAEPPAPPQPRSRWPLAIIVALLLGALTAAVAVAAGVDRPRAAVAGAAVATLTFLVRFLARLSVAIIVRWPKINSLG